MVQDNVHQIKAYQGTSLARANIILKSRHFISSTDNDEWLGSGIYFYPYMGSAVKWAKSNRVPAVVSVILRFQGNQFCDLDKTYNLRALESCFRSYMNDLEREGQIIPRFSKEDFESRKKTWCLSCDIYKEENKNVKLMAYTFSMSYDTLSGFEFKQRQFCATDNSIIFDICQEAI